MIQGMGRFSLLTIVLLSQCMVSCFSGSCVSVGDAASLRNNLESRDTEPCLTFSNDIYIGSMITVYGNKSIIGNGFSLIAESSISSRRQMLSISSAAVLFLKELTISNAPNGAIILKGQGALHVYNCTFSDNYAVQGGSVVWIEQGSNGVINASSSVFKNNNAGNGLGSCVRFSPRSSTLFISKGNIFYNNFPFNGQVIYSSKSSKSLSSPYEMNKYYKEDGDMYNQCESGFIRSSRTTACVKCPIFSDCPRSSDAINRHTQSHTYSVISLRIACVGEHHRGEQCELCERGYYKLGYQCVKCDGMAHFLRFLCSIGLLGLVMIVSHISLNISETSIKSVEYQTCQVMKDILYDKIVKHKKQLVFEKLRHSYRSMMHGFNNYYLIKTRTRKLIQLLVESITGAICSTLLIGISHMQVACLLVLPLLRASLSTKSHSDESDVNDDLIQTDRQSSQSGDFLLSFVSTMNWLFNFNFVSLIFSPTCAEERAHALSRFLLALIPFLVIALYFGSKAVALESSRKHLSYHALVSGSIFYQLTLLPLAYMFASVLLGSVRTYDDEERLLMSDGTLPILVGEKSNSHNNYWSFLLFGSLEHSHGFPIRLLGGICLLWLLRYALIEAKEVTRLLSDEPTYDIKDTSLGCVVRSVPATFIRTCSPSGGEALFNDKVSKSQSRTTTNRSQPNLKEIEHRLSEKLIPLNQLYEHMAIRDATPSPGQTSPSTASPRSNRSPRGDNQSSASSISSRSSATSTKSRSAKLSPTRSSHNTSFNGGGGGGAPSVATYDVFDEYRAKERYAEAHQQESDDQKEQESAWDKSYQLEALANDLSELGLELDHEKVKEFRNRLGVDEKDKIDLKDFEKEVSELKQTTELSPEISLMYDSIMSLVPLEERLIGLTFGQLCEWDQAQDMIQSQTLPIEKLKLLFSQLSVEDNQGISVLKKSEFGRFLDLVGKLVIVDMKKMIDDISIPKNEKGDSHEKLSYILHERDFYSIDPLVIYDAWGSGDWRIGFIHLTGPKKLPPHSFSFIPFSNTVIFKYFGKVVMTLLYIFSCHFIIEKMVLPLTSRLYLFAAKSGYSFIVILLKLLDQCGEAIFNKVFLKPTNTVVPVKTSDEFKVDEESVQSGQTPDASNSRKASLMESSEKETVNKSKLEKLMKDNRQSFIEIQYDKIDKKDKEKEMKNELRRLRYLGSDNKETLFALYKKYKYDFLSEIYTNFKSDYLKQLDLIAEVRLRFDCEAKNYILIRSNRRRGGEVVLYLYGFVVKTINMVLKHCLFSWFESLSANNWNSDSEDEQGGRLEEGGGGGGGEEAESGQQNQKSFSSSHLFKCCFLPTPVLASCESIMKLGKSDADFMQYLSYEHSFDACMNCCQNTSDLFSRLVRDCLINPLSYPLAPLCFTLDMILRRFIFTIALVMFLKSYFEMSTVLNDIKVYNHYYYNTVVNDDLNQDWLEMNGNGINIYNICMRVALSLSLCLLALVFHFMITVTVLPHRDAIDNYMAAAQAFLEVIQMLLTWRRVQLTTPKWSQYLIPTNSRVFLSSSQNFLWAFDKFVKVLLKQIDSETGCNIVQLLVIVLGILVFIVGINRKYLWQKKQESTSSVYSVISKSSKSVLKAKHQKYQRQRNLDARFRKAFGRDRADVIQSMGADAEDDINLNDFGLIDMNLFEGEEGREGNSSSSPFSPHPNHQNNLPEKTKNEEHKHFHKNASWKHGTYKNDGEHSSKIENKRRRHSIGSVIVTPHGMVENKKGSSTANKQRRHSFHALDSSSSGSSLHSDKKGSNVSSKLSLRSERRGSGDESVTSNSSQNTASRKSIHVQPKRRGSEGSVHSLTDFAREHAESTMPTPRLSLDKQEAPGSSSSVTIVPHFRHECPTYKFDLSYPRSHDQRCGLCVCYACDKRASSCEEWTTGKGGGDHCHAHPDFEIWRSLREQSLVRSRTGRRSRPSSATGVLTSDAKRSHHLPPLKN